MFGVGAGWGRRLPANLIPEARRAVQGQRQVSPPYPEAEGVVHFWPFWGNKRTGKNGRPLGSDLGQWGCCAGEAVSLPGSGALVLKRSEAQQGEPMRVAFAGHQFPRAFADALGKLAAHEAPMVEEEAQQIQLLVVGFYTGRIQGPPRIWGSGGNSGREECVVGWMEFLSEFGTERTVVDRAPNLKQQVRAAS
jgi:hypothetical protein